MDRRRHAAAVQEQDRLAAAFRDPAELLEERRRERIPGLAAQIDDPHLGHGRADSGRQREPLERQPALRSRCGAAVDRDRALERGALRRHRARVVAGIGLLLVRRVVLLVDDDKPECRDGGEDRRARADDDRCVAGRNPLALVPTFSLGEP